MQSIPIDEVTVSESRQRKEFSDVGIRELSNSIFDKGLLHPIILQNDGHRLIAGERRLRAVRLLYAENSSFNCDGKTVPLNEIPYTRVADLTDFQIEEAELEENLKREDLSWQEEAAAISRLHDMREEQHGAAKPGDGGKGWTATDTINEILSSPTNRDLLNFRETRILANHLDDEEVANAKTRKDALRIIEKKAAAKQRADLAREFGEHKTPHQVVHANCLGYMSGLKTASIDLIITDPPYGINADSFGDQSVTDHVYEDTPAYFESVIPDAIEQISRLARQSAACYIFCDIRNWPRIVNLLTDWGWRTFATPLIWNKGSVGMLPWPHSGPRRCYEAIAYAIRGRDVKVNSVQSDIINIEGLQRPTFAAEKPVDLFANLLSRSAKPGYTVLDPFAGSGPIIPACNRHQCKAIAIEMDEDKYNHMLTRLEE